MRSNAIRAAGLTLATGMALGAPALADDLKIGVIGPLSGPAAVSGLSMQQAYQARVDKLNAEGGVTLDGEPAQIELIFEDSASRPEQGVSAAQKLLTRDDVDILIGDSIASSVTLAVMEVSASYGKFTMSGQPVSIEISKKVAAQPDRFANFWKTGFNSDNYGATLWETVQMMIADGTIEAGDKKVAFIVEDTDYGKSNMEYAAPLFDEGGWTVASSETVSLGYADFYPQISKLRGDAPDVLISVFTSVNSGVALVKQLAEQGVETPHLAIYYPIRSEFLEGAGEQANGLLWSPLLFDAVNNPRHAEFSTMYEALAGNPANGDHALGWCQMDLLLGNLAKAGTAEPAALSAAFKDTDYSCVVGRYVFDPETHSPLGGADYLPAPTAQIQDGVSYAVWPKNQATREISFGK
ncbi:ABC transporter substrate-binding protein [Albimonas sp. CAU 1670]|uniref:ABC transporter substrate-binding protein n=1 Tax=Albimonas sp. CAU 1670 TaxID=3032599 RepID=UPI0023DBE8B7|nr:ABC transporter substrate-binding protein [Albimonas sp. CAU 1670]MDF2234753.1 ABC transporter substrate-binding protein [Albimonas sp. CAU 1670]